MVPLGNARGQMPELIQLAVGGILAVFVVVGVGVAADVADVAVAGAVGRKEKAFPARCRETSSQDGRRHNRRCY